eukprot:GFUD01009177.1.p1 GENE.GFUD01009177.1~~GFUD01009177.1.p1  ORF type:complete len:283 (+),score=74.21 GFUD01009177.1:59-907(+)
MWSSGAIAQSEEYVSFRGSVPLKKITIGDDGKTWQVYDSGSRDSGSPLVCLPPIAGTADIFFKQCLALSVRGYRVLAVEWPAYWSLKEWCQGFKGLLDHLNLERVHLFGAALGGFLAQKFAEHTRSCPRVASLVLCNSFTDTSIFKYSEESSAFWLMPSLVLKRLVMTGLEMGKMDQQMVDATDFILERLESLGHAELASRLTLTCAPAHVEPQNVNDLPVTIIDVFDECALTQEVREETYKFYPGAKMGHLKSGGNFPYLSRSEEVNLYLSIHLRNFESAI